MYTHEHGVCRPAKHSHDARVRARAPPGRSERTRVRSCSGNSSICAYGGRGQPGDGEYMSALTAGGLDAEGLHILAVTLDSSEGRYHGYFDGAPALVASFASGVTPSTGSAQIGGSSTSRSRRFHGLIAEVREGMTKLVPVRVKSPIRL
eukprot:1074836-Pleurochrysis_carterae.AAC.1